MSLPNKFSLLSLVAGNTSNQESVFRPLLNSNLHHLNPYPILFTIQWLKSSLLVAVLLVFLQRTLFLNVVQMC
ncbi:hypothetical protein J3R82DRAFT_10151 [Butyriboletus roseoflavus]|nr:hypothetical protein J3R82DRAFT_10151 [Butyriboletus roseoflavus]